VNNACKPSTDESPLVTVNILCFNRRDKVRQVLERIQEVEYVPLQIIVVDNGSSDGTAELIRHDFPYVELVYLPSNTGIGAWNEGFRRARGKYVLTLDDDCYPGRGSIDRMVEAFDANPKLGIVTFEIRIGDSGAVDNEFMRGEPSGSASGGYVADNFIGCAVGIRRTLFDEIGYFDEDIFLYQHEVDFSVRVLNAGYTIEYMDGCVGHHMIEALSTSGRYTSPRKNYFIFRNVMWFWWKYFPVRWSIYLTVKELLWRAVAALVYAVREKDVAWIKYYLLTVWQVVAGIPRMRRKRVRISPQLLQHYLDHGIDRMSFSHGKRFAQTFRRWFAGR